MTPLELDALEARLQHPIPAPYRELLTHTGAGEHGDVQVYHPLEIEEAYQYHFEEPEELFNTYFPFGCNQRSQEIWPGPVNTIFRVAKALAGVPI